jgi:hypothetical protein
LSETEQTQQPSVPTLEFVPGVTHSDQEKVMQRDWKNFAERATSKTNGEWKQSRPETKQVDPPEPKDYDKWSENKGEVPLSAEKETERDGKAPAETEAAVEPPSDLAERQVWHTKNYQDFQHTVTADPEVQNSLTKIHVQPERGTIILHTLADQPKSVQKLVLNHLANDQQLQWIFQNGPAYANQPDKLVESVRMLAREVPKLLAQQEREKADNRPRAPKPPSEVGGRGSGSGDALVAAAKAGDFRAFEKEQWERVRASRR